MFQITNQSIINPPYLFRRKISGGELFLDRWPGDRLGTRTKDPRSLGQRHAPGSSRSPNLGREMHRSHGLAMGQIGSNSSWKSDRGALARWILIIWKELAAKIKEFDQLNMEYQRNLTWLCDKWPLPAKQILITEITRKKSRIANKLYIYIWERWKYRSMCISFFRDTMDFHGFSSVTG